MGVRRRGSCRVNSNFYTRARANTHSLSHESTPPVWLTHSLRIPLNHPLLPFLLPPRVRRVFISASRSYGHNLLGLLTDSSIYSSSSIFFLFALLPLLTNFCWWREEEITSGSRQLDSISHAHAVKVPRQSSPPAAGLNRTYASFKKSTA